MASPQHTPEAPKHALWDLKFTKLAQDLQPQLNALRLELLRRYKAIGLAIDTNVRQTPRGLSTLLALVGQRGLICIVDITLIDGMAVGHGPLASLDIRLLDACGDVAAEGIGRSALGQAFCANLAAQALSAEQLDRAATAVYVASLAHFDLLRPASANAGNAH
ncbi:hypothetical protein [Roseateles albus]|uniref:Uncharacterized protein n=1 Tax=Roseateles albus TaxID=2987525 RepID=A0ABT5KIE1_9BURK|nr:hypothetical protein [Roseateles albus]MDC8773712.1 hypothetical protein [Roseateles albus]